ncbi:hypothetical protein [Streptomyces pseudogriseolus]|uniref:hypothetical protein n=1 Tax=Streptomyces pseudogriseolus TaxID=36817 RepID=UPI003FA1B073
MPEQTVTQWTRPQWDQYIQQVNDSVTYLEISSHQPLRPTFPTITYTCPVCLYTQSGIDLVQSENGETFTATWRDCEHRVSVPIVDVIPPPSFLHDPVLTARFHCPRHCSWSYDEFPSLEPAAPIRLRARAQASTLAEALADVTQEDIAAAIMTAADERDRAFRARLKDAYARHYAQAHPGITAPTPAAP